MTASIDRSLSTPRTRRGRGTLAVVAGLLANIVLAFVIDQSLHSSGVYPPWGQPMSDRLFALATAYRIVIGVFGAWLVARLAPDRPMRHALVLGAIGFAISAAGTVVTAVAHNPALGPVWYPALLALAAPPASWLGATLHRR